MDALKDRRNNATWSTTGSTVLGIAASQAAGNNGTWLSASPKRVILRPKKRIGRGLIGGPA
jgi:hypothetical protein